MKEKIKNPILDEPCQGWCFSCSGEEDCDCASCRYYRKTKDDPIPDPNDKVADIAVKLMML